MRLNVRRVWQYAFAVAVLMFIIGIAIDTTDVSVYTRRVSNLMAAGDYEQALQVGARSDKTTRSLMLLRMEALDHEHLMGERLFRYPIVGKGSPFIAKGGDYELCGYLIDKDLVRFVAALPRYYKVDGSLPRHYREALVLYGHKSAHSDFRYDDAVMETDYADMQQQKRKYHDARARQMAVFSNYEGTYWYYYDYLGKH